MLTSALVVLACTVAIWICSERLSHGTGAIGEVYRISPSVRGATLDAVASSFPEFCTVIFALFAGAFDAGVGTIAGSALFNILVIPALASLACGGLEVHRDVIRRDGLLYLAVVIAFIAALFFGPTGDKGADYRFLPAWVGFAALVTYSGYVVYMVLSARASAGAAEPSERSDASVPKAVANVTVGMAGVGVACHFLVEHGLNLITSLGFSAAVAGVTILAAATSLPDTLLSVFAARRGDADGAIANAFASNTFDILICLGLPVLMMGGLQMNWTEGRSILICLLLSTITAIAMMISKWRLTRTESVFKLAIYVGFCVGIFMGWL